MVWLVEQTGLENDTQKSMDQVVYFPADWDLEGKSAGFKRNVKMAEYADALVAFWDGESKGTKHMIEIAKEKGLDIRIKRYHIRRQE